MAKTQKRALNKDSKELRCCLSSSKKPSKQSPTLCKAHFQVN